MPHPPDPPTETLLGRLRARFGDRAIGIVAALLLEALLLLVLLHLGGIGPGAQGPEDRVVSFDMPSASQPEAEPDSPAEASDSAAPAPDSAPPPPSPAPTPAPATPVQPVPLATPDPTNIAPPQPTAAPQPQPSPPAPPQPQTPARPRKPGVRMGPAQGPPGGPAGGASGPADSGVVGTAPNGETLYAAEWYRKPYDDELRGYLSTASGPGWALIACRTVPDYRVEDCVALGESPRGSNMARAVLAAAWQFRVRPARVNGKSQVGSWVRIRIDYTQRPK